jgi:N-acetylneuraminate synthase
MYKEFVLGERSFGYLNPFIIAEIGVNHEGSLELAKRMIAQVSESGGHAVKFQTYTADKLATKEFSPAYWDTSKEVISSQHELFQKWPIFTEKEYSSLLATASDCGVVFMSTPFDLEAVEMLDPMVPAFKIASADITNIPLIRSIGSKQKPVIVSVGAANFDEINTAVQELIQKGCIQITLLHCVLRYPTPTNIAYLRQINDLIAKFADVASIGYSDHVPPNQDGGLPQLELATILGSVVLEKHFTHDKSLPGNDHYHAMEASELKRFTQKIYMYRELFGEGSLNLVAQSEAISNARRRVVAKRDLEVGETLEESDLLALRANVGIEIGDWDKVIGSITKVRVKANQPLSWSDL